MTQFKVHDRDSAPEGAVAHLEQTEKAFGFVPNLIGTFAEAPAAVEAYLALDKIFDKSSFSATERQLVLLAVSRYNECRYCLAAHSAIAGMQDVPRNVVDAIRNDEPLSDDKLEALRRFTTTVVDKRGWVSEADVSAFEDAGYSRQQVLEVILGIAFKTLSNYTNHIAETPLDEAFEAEEWQPAEKRRTG